MCIGDDVSEHAKIGKYGLGVAIGLLCMGYAAQTYLWFGYMKVNPSGGAVYISTGFRVFYAGLFVIGTIIAYTSFMRGLASTFATITDE